MAEKILLSFKDFCTLGETNYEILLIMHAKFLLAFFLLFLHFIHAQELQKMISQKKSELAASSDPKERATIYSDLTWYYASVSVDSALSYGNKAISQAKTINDSVLLAQVYSDLGAVHFRNNDFKNSEKNYLNSYKIRKKKKDAKGIAKLNNNLASVYRNLSLPQKSMKMYFEALKYFESVSDNENVNVTKANIGIIFKDLKNYAESEKYLKNAISYFEKTKNNARLCENYVNLGSALQLQNKYDDAIKYYNISNEKCLKVGNTQAIAYIARNLANVYGQKNNDSASAQKLKESEAARKKFNSDLDLASLDVEKASNLLKTGEIEQAEKKFLQLKKIFENQNSPEDLLNVYRNLITIKAHLNQADSAEFYLHQYTSENDRLYKLSVAKQTQELSTKYETAEKDKEILENKNKIFKRNVAVFSLLGLLLLGVIYYKNFQHRQKIKFQNEILHQQNLSAKAVMNAEDHERKRMAMHLHDGVGQMLTATNMNLQVLEDYRDQPDAFSTIITKTRKILVDAMAEVRTLSHQIMPNMLIKNSLSNALKDLIDKCRSPKLNIGLQIEGLQDNLDENIQIVMYRVIQECINNTIKHAQADEISISVKQDEHQIFAEFKDNGIGFDAATQRKSDGMGLDNIKSRIEFMKGNFELKSEKGSGTLVRVELPL